MTIKPLKRYLTRSIPLTIAILALIALLAATALAAPDYVAGDVDGNGVIDVRDVVMVVKHTLGLQYPPLTETQLLAADINGDGEINVSDAVEIMKIALGLTDSYPMPIVSLNDAVVRVPIGTALADINLPTTVEANFAGGQKRNISVRWERVSTPAYNPFVFDEYIFKGDLINLPQGVRNPSELRATARVSYLLRDPWPFPQPGQYSLRLLSSQPGVVLSGSGNYNANERVCVSATPDVLGIQFLNWTDAADGTIVSTNSTYCFDMPPRNIVLVANFGSLTDFWPLELEDEILAGGGLGNIWWVTLTVKPEYADEVAGIIVKGEEAVQDMTDPLIWRVALVQTTRPTIDELRGQVTVLSTSPGQIDVIDMTRTRAFYVDIPYDVTVRVYIKPGQSVTNVTADGFSLTPPPLGGEYWFTYLDGYSIGDLIQIRAINNNGVQTEIITVQ